VPDSDPPENKPSEKIKLPRKGKILKPFDAARWQNLCNAMAEDIAQDAEKVERGEPPLVTKKRLTKAERKEAEQTLNEVRGWAGLPPLQAEEKSDNPKWTKRTRKGSGKIVPDNDPKER
jgi:hypothetical protein